MDTMKRFDKEFEDFKEYVLKWLTADPAQFGTTKPADPDLMGKRVDMILDVLSKEKDVGNG